MTPLPKEIWNKVSQEYGALDCKTYPKTCRHIGTDFLAPLGTPIVAPKDCEVTRSGFSPAIGYWFEAKIDDWYLVALHCQGTVKKGLYAPGQTIQYVGKTGYINGIHAHLEGWICPRDVSKLNKSNWQQYTFDVKKKIDSML